MKEFYVVAYSLGLMNYENTLHTGQQTSRVCKAYTPMNDGKAANKVAATVSTLNVHAAEWKATVDVLDDKFTG